MDKMADASLSQAEVIISILKACNKAGQKGVRTSHFLTIL